MRTENTDQPLGVRLVELSIEMRSPPTWRSTRDMKAEGWTSPPAEMCYATTCFSRARSTASRGTAGAPASTASSEGSAAATSSIRR